MPDKHHLIVELKNLLRSDFGGMIQDVILFGSRAAETAKAFITSTLSCYPESDIPTRVETRAHIPMP